MHDWRQFAAGFNVSRWCIGLQIHDYRHRYGYGVIEVNLLPLSFYFRFGNGMKRLHCQLCDAFICEVDPDESESATCMQCYEELRAERAERDASKR